MGPGAGVPKGTVIGGRFRIDTLVGAGGWGAVYRSLDGKTNKPVAIRILAPDLAADEQTLEHLRDEVKLASALQHKNVAALFGMGKEGNLRYIAFEFIEGQALRQLLSKKRRGGRTFSLKGAYNVLAHVCNGLQQVHQTTVHGLPGPGSILVNQTGRVKLCETGLVRALSPTSPVLERLGDAYCLAPEVLADPSHASPFSDLYAVGVVLYELLTGRQPTCPDYAPASSLIPGLPPEVDEVLARCLNPDPAGRFADPGQLKAAFYAAVQSAHEQAEVEGFLDVSTAPGPVTAPARPDRPAPPPSLGPAARPVATPPAPLRAVDTGPKPPPRPAAPAAPSVPGPGLTPQLTGPALPMSAPMPGPGPAFASPPSVAPAAAAAGGDTLDPYRTDAAPRGLGIEDHLREAERVQGDRFLVHKDRLDFGPFTLSDLMRQMLKGQFTGDDMVLDQETGQRTRILVHPLLRDFSSLASRQVATEKMNQAEQEQRQQDKKRRTVIVVSILLALTVLGGGGVVAAYFLYFRKPKTLEKVVYRDKQGDPELKMKGIDITWKNEPPDQAARRKKLGRKRPGKKGVGGGDDVTYLGDATKEGGDALLSQGAIQGVMQANFKKLTRCVYEEMRRSPGLRDVNIDFGIRGSGSVSSVTVNGQSGGPFAGCILAQMMRIKFPPFDGTLTRASFSMSLK